MLQQTPLVLLKLVGNQLIIFLGLAFVAVTHAFTLPDNFTDTVVVDGLQDPGGFAFSPDGRLFISERITGKLRVANYQPATDSWLLNTTPFYTFDIPKNDLGQPEARRSAGLRDIAFDPDFASNGYIYAFYMQNETLQNRVVRIKASASNPDLADAAVSEQLLINLPFNNTASSGSHNGGALEFGDDGLLYITTGDGWEGEFAGDSVQSLTSFTGKVLRINPNGNIPNDNPFYNQTTGTYRAIYALGLRNPYTMSKHPDTGALYINEARGSNKADIYVVASGANYRHEGTGIGMATNPWANAATPGGELITGGAWMPEAGLGNFPALYNGMYFVALWGSNSSNTGRINVVTADDDNTVSSFATGLGVIGENSIPVKPVVTKVGLNGDLYYLLTTYTTNSGTVRRIRFTSQETVVTPQFSPQGGNSVDAITVTINTSTPDAEIRYTLDNTTPTKNSNLYTVPVIVSQSAVLRAKGFKTNFNPSGEASAVYIIGDSSNNEPPQVDAGSDQIVFVGQTVTLDGSGTTDPDGDDDFLTGEQWTQTAGPPVIIQDATEEIAFFTPMQTGVYEFSLQVSDGIDTSNDQVTISAIIAPRVTAGLQALYTFEEGGGAAVYDMSGVGAPLDLTIAPLDHVEWLSNGGIDITDSVVISSLGSQKINQACGASNAISLEAWLLPENTNQSGPARILSLSTDVLNRNFTLGQQADRFDVRLRTSETNNNGTPSLTVPASTVKTELTHVLYTRTSNGDARIYINAVPQVVGQVSGVMNNWDSNYNLLLANEQGGDRAWLGELHLIAVYCGALSSSEVQQNFAAGLPPFSSQVDTDNDTIVDLFDNCPFDANMEQLNTDGDSLGNACDNDIDNDGIENAADNAPLDVERCQDLDLDQCDDCALGVDGFGPLSDADSSRDGDDNDQDGQCDVGDLDDDNDSVLDDSDNCPYHPNPDQRDSNNNDLGDICDPAEQWCIAIKAKNNKVATICF